MTDAPLFSLKPVFIGWIALLTQLPLQLFFTLWTGGFFGGMISGFLSIKSFGPAFIIGAVTFVAFPAITYFGKKLNYARTEYRFYADRLEFDEGFFTLQKKVIKYRDMKEVTLREGVLQRIYGLGTIYLATLATGATRANPFSALGFGNVSASGINVCDVANPNEVYQKVRQIVDVDRSPI